MSKSNELATVDEAEAIVMAEPQVGCAVTHHFGPGVYLRQVTVKAGHFAISHRHRYPHTNLVLAGAIAMRQDDGPIHVVAAPHFYVAPPGRKMGLAIYDLVWVNIFPTEETDVEKLEARLFDKSPVFWDLAEKIYLEREASHIADRVDFHALLAEWGITPEQAREASEREDDLIGMTPSWGIVIRRSPIEGRGVYTQLRTLPGEIIGPARLCGKRTLIGRYANHSLRPNARFVRDPNGDALLVATKTIEPFCSETVPGDEVVVDYRQVKDLVGVLR